MVPHQIDTTTTALDVLEYIDWVFGLLYEAELRSDPSKWQRDMSWEEMMACAGVDPGDWALPEPGDVIGTELGTAELYWPCTGP
jgi:hypothetical protein